MTVWYIYIIKTAQTHLYTGITTDIARRLRQHRGLIKGGAKALRGKGPLTLECVFEVADKSTALIIEAWIKRLSRSSKWALIKHNLNPPHGIERVSDVIIQQMNSVRHPQ